MSSSNPFGTDNIRTPAWTVFAGHDAPSTSTSTSTAPMQALTQAPSMYADIQRAQMEAARILADAADAAEQASHEAEGAVGRARAEGLAQGRAEAEFLLRSAQLEVEKARTEAEAMKQMALAEAKATRAEAEVSALVTLANARTQVEALLTETRELRDRRLDEAQAAVVDLAVIAAMRLVQGQLALKPESIVRMVAAGVRRLRESDCTVRVALHDLPLLEAQRHVLERELATGSLQLMSDSGLVSGDYVASSSIGQVDGRLEQQSTQLQVALKAALGG